MNRALVICEDGFLGAGLLDHFQKSRISSFKVHPFLQDGSRFDADRVYAGLTNPNDCHFEWTIDTFLSQIKAFHDTFELCARQPVLPLIFTVDTGLVLKRGRQVTDSFRDFLDVTMENMAEKFWIEKRVPSVCLRIANAYGGPYEDEDKTHYSLIRRVVDYINVGERPVIVEGRSDFVHIFDVVRAIEKASNFVQDHPGVWKFEIGSGIMTDHLKIVKMINEIYGTAYLPRTGWCKETDSLISNPRADIRMAEKILGWEPRIPLDRGLLHTVNLVNRRRNM